jgi:hypothetical protein
MKKSIAITFFGGSAMDFVFHPVTPVESLLS